MSDRITSISAPGVWGSGYAVDGRASRAEMISTYRKFHAQKLEEAQSALAVPDGELKVYTYLGPWAQKSKQEVTE